MTAPPITITYAGTAQRCIYIEDVLRQEPMFVVFNSIDTSNMLLLLSESYQTMLASENVLAREWNTAEEDEAWAHLTEVR